MCWSELPLGRVSTCSPLQCAMGIFPQQTYINQPVELVLILQNMVDQNMQLKIGLQLPTEDRKGRPIVIDTPRKTFVAWVAAR